MRSLAFMRECSIEVYDFLFSGIEKTTDLEFASEILENYFNGGIDMANRFNIQAYNQTVRKNQRLLASAGAKRSMYIYEADEGDEGTHIGGIISEALSDYKDDYKSADDADELSYTLAKLRGMKDVFLQVHGVDVSTLLKQAVRGIPDAVTRLRELCGEDVQFAEMVQVMLSSGESMEDMLRGF